MIKNMLILQLRFNSLSDEDKATKLTAEYLCSVVEECTQCSYLVIDDEGNESYNLITPEKHEYDALLPKAATFRSSVNKIVPLADITEIKYSDTIPDGVNKVNIADTKSKYPLYVWNVGTVIYLNTNANNIFFNSDSKSMFQSWTSLKTVDTTKWRMEEIVSAQSMFQGCTSLETIDTTNWNFVEATTFYAMFNNDSNLKRINMKNWNAQKITNIAYMFVNCYNLGGTIDMSGWSFANLDSMSYAFGVNDEKKENYIEYIYLPKTTNKITMMEGVFVNCKNLKKIYNLENFYAKSVKNMSMAFKNCIKLEAIDLSRWEAPNLTSFAWVFQNCNLIKELDLSHFDFSKINSLNGTFYNCTALEKVTFGNKNFQNVTAANATFLNCMSLKEIDLSNADFSNVTSLAQFFYKCESLERINLSNVKANNNKSLEKTFIFLNKLTELNLSGFEDQALENMSIAFGNCGKVKHLDLSSLNAKNVKNMNQAFYAMKEVETIDMSGIKSKSVSLITNAFNGCLKLNTIYASNEWSLSIDNDDDKKSTFWRCESLPGYATNKISGDYCKSKESGGYFTIK